MPYTLMKGLVWVLLAVVLGIIIGWLLRSVAAKRQVERARAANVGTADQQELERLRNRVANLEPVVAERDRLRAELNEERTR
jgi:Tfp pilus assembly protein PilO